MAVVSLSTWNGVAVDLRGLGHRFHDGRGQWRRPTTFAMLHENVKRGVHLMYWMGYMFMLESLTL